MNACRPRGLVHIAAGVDLGGVYDAGPYVDLTRLAERGALDFVTLGDSLGRPGPDALAVLSRAAPATARIGLVPTVTTTHADPLHVRAAVATLDRVSRGRAGWRIDVSTGTGDARLLGHGSAVPLDRLWRDAGEVADACARLWDGGDGRDGGDGGGGGEDAAGMRDTATGRFVAPGEPRLVDFDGGDFDGGDFDGDVFAGDAFSVPGPSIVPRRPQGHPVTVVDATDPHARDTAARYADVALVAAPGPDRAAAVRAELRAAAGAYGRDPDTLRVFAALAVDLGGGEYAAEPGHGGGGPRPSPRGPLYRGGPVDLAELIAAWHETGAADGFHLTPVEPRRDLERLVNGTVPLLQHRALFRSFYPGDTLREHLGLARPAPRYTPTRGH
ncbi:LLM class flavin-dependent oxidoreductase [Streptomyces sp. NPDC058001]|uniref:LLM class flavin-dependent oxidoreductase n=1 Tax=Streptomyces sp. NPDC058001 TaxID=3346300 RepID=UPI0036E03CB0